MDRVVFCAAHYRASRAQGGDLDDWLRHNQVNCYVGALHLLHAGAAAPAGPASGAARATSA